MESRIRPVPSPGRHTGRDSGFTLIEVLIVLAFLAVIAAIAIQAALYAFDVSRLGKTVGNMRGVATVLMQYESTTGTLPAGGLQPVGDIEPVLRLLGAPVPLQDGWGNDLYYEPVTSGGEVTFRVYSYGKDNTPDGAVTGVWVDFFSDVVMEAGSFIQTKW